MEKWAHRAWQDRASPGPFLLPQGRDELVACGVTDTLLSGGNGGAFVGLSWIRSPHPSARQGQPGPALPDEAETPRPPLAPGAEHLTGSGGSGGVPASAATAGRNTLSHQRTHPVTVTVPVPVPRRFRPVPPALPAPPREEAPGAAVSSPKPRVWSPPGER